MDYANHYLNNSHCLSNLISVSKESLIGVAMDTSAVGASNIKTERSVAAIYESYAGKPLDDPSKLQASIRRLPDNVSRRLNYRRYASKRETLSHIKVLLALNLLIPTMQNLNEEEDGIKLHVLNIRVLANLCSLSVTSAREALKYWVSEGLIVLSAYGKGKYLISFSKKEISRKYAPSSEGGAGYIVLPYAVIKAMLEIRTVDVLRLMITVYLNMDSNLYDRAFFLNGTNVSGKGTFVRFVRLHEHASYSALINSFNNEMTRLTNGAIRLSVPDTGESRFDSINISMRVDYSPKQKGSANALDQAERDLYRILKKEDVTAFEDILQSFLAPGTGSFSPRLNLLFPNKDGDSWAKESSSMRPSKDSQTLVPAITTIKNLFGDGYIRGALISLFHNMSDKLSKLFESVKPSNKEFDDIIQELSAYLVSVAREEHFSHCSSWHNFENYNMIA